MNSTQRDIINIIDAHTKNSEYGETFARRIFGLFAKDPQAGANEVIYLLDEKIYYLLGWAKRHQEEGVIQKAQQEEQDALMLEAILKELLPMQAAA